MALFSSACSALNRSYIMAYIVSRVNPTLPTSMNDGGVPSVLMGVDALHQQISAAFQPVYLLVLLGLFAALLLIGTVIQAVSIARYNPRKIFEKAD